MAGLPIGRLDRGWNQVVHEAATLDVAALIVTYLFEQCGRHPHRKAAMHLTLYDHRIDDVSAIVDGDETPDMDLPRSSIDVDDADIASKGKGEVGRVVIRGRLEPRLHALRVVRVCREGDLLDRFDLLRCAA